MFKMSISLESWLKGRSNKVSSAAQRETDVCVKFLFLTDFQMVFVNDYKKGRQGTFLSAICVFIYLLT